MNTELKSALLRMLYVFVMTLVFWTLSVVLNYFLHFEGGWKECMQWVMYGQILSMLYDVKRLNRVHDIGL